VTSLHPICNSETQRSHRRARDAISSVAARRWLFPTTTASSWQDARQTSPQKPNVSLNYGTTFCALPTANHNRGNQHAVFYLHLQAYFECCEFLPVCL